MFRELMAVIHKPYAAVWKEDWQLQLCHIHYLWNSVPASVWVTSLDHQISFDTSYTDIDNPYVDWVSITHGARLSKDAHLDICSWIY